MSEPEVKFEIDEYGRIGYRVTNEGVLLSKDENEFIIDHITRMKEENSKLRKLVDYMTPIAWYAASERERDRMRELGVEVN